MAEEATATAPPEASPAPADVREDIEKAMHVISYDDAQQSNVLEE
jgi:hypothetical protein